MVQFSDLPSEIVTQIFRSIPLSDLYFSIDKYALIIDPYVCVITDSSNSKFTKLFKNIIQFRDFNSKFDKLTEISFVILQIVNIEETLSRKEFSFVYKILKERNKDTIFIIEDLGEHPTRIISEDLVEYPIRIISEVDPLPNIFALILRFSWLFNKYPHNNLLVFKDIDPGRSFPWSLNSFVWDVIRGDEVFNISNRIIEDFRYLFRNLVIEGLGDLDFETRDPTNFAFNRLSLTDNIEDTVIFKGIKEVTINFEEEPLQTTKFERIFDILNNNADSIKKLAVVEEKDNYRLMHKNSGNFELLLKCCPRLFERIRELEIDYQYQTILNNFSLPNLQSLQVCYSAPEGEISDSPLTVNNLNVPKLKYLKLEFTKWESRLFMNELLALEIIHGHTLRFGHHSTRGNIEPSTTTNRCKADYFFRSILDFELSKKIRRLELQTPSLEIFNRMVNEKSDFTFDSLEELSIICFSYSKMDRFLNQSISDTLTHKKQYLTLKKLEIDIIAGGDPIQITTLNSGNIPSLEDLCIKASWERFNSIRSLQVISLPVLSFMNLRVLKLEDLILPNFKDLNLPNMKEMYLKDVYEDELFSGLSIIGELTNLRTIELECTARKTILREKICPELQVQMDRTIGIYLERWIKILPVITIEKTVYDRLTDLKYSKEAVTFNLT